MKSDGAIKTDVYRYINESGFMNNVNGKLSKTMRPHNSHKEDVVISILANEGTQLQTAKPMELLRFPVWSIQLSLADLLRILTTDSSPSLLNALSTFSCIFLAALCRKASRAEALVVILMPISYTEVDNDEIP